MERGFDPFVDGIHAALDALEGSRPKPLPPQPPAEPVRASEMVTTSRGGASSTGFDPYSVENAIKIFKKVDADNSGEIDIDELDQAFSDLGMSSSRAELLELIAHCDTNGDSHISQDEFITMVREIKTAGNSKWKVFMESQATGMMMLDASKRSLYKDLEDNILVNLAKAGGSVVMLRDNKGKIYKEMNDAEELEFYALVHEARKGGSQPDVFLRYLNEERLIPQCDLKGYVKKLSDEESAQLPDTQEYYKLTDEEDPDGVEVIIMENLIQGMNNPASCDFKLGDQYTGSYPGEPGYAQVKMLLDNGEALDYDQKREVFKRFKMYKSGKNKDGVALKEITNEHVGLKTAMTYKDIKPLMKAFRQELNNLESPVKELKFRCCGMKAIPQEGQELNFKYEPHHSAGEIHMTKPTGMSPNAVSELIEDFCQGDSELAKYFIKRLNDLALWFSNNTHYRFYASSVCLFYDLDDHSKRSVRWLDFAHAHKMVHEDGSTHWERKNNGGEINNSVLVAINNLVDLLAPIVWNEDNA